jgi:hypothetical protein
MIIYGNINVSNREVDVLSARKSVKFWRRSPRIAVSERLYTMSMCNLGHRNVISVASVTTYEHHIFFLS